MGIKIVADNCCDLPDEILERYNINLTHLLVRFGDRVYQPGELSNAQFYEKMESSPVLPCTSQPSVEEIVKVYSEALEDGSEVIAIHFSSGISGTFQGGMVAGSMINNPRLHVFDSHKASVGCGLLVLEAARMAQNGDNLETIMRRLEEMRRRVQCVFAVGNMECLIKGGRISRAMGTVADVLDIKPILYLDDEGYIKPYDKARGYKGAMRKLLSIMEKTGYNLNRQVVGVVHGNYPEAGQQLSEMIKERFGVKEVVIGEVGPVIGSHVGRGTFSVFFEKQ
ncbi:MAG: DegV family protein [Syntrophomonas sp.]